jgi:glycosyltransferase involved in cell wall biosynthesis
MAAALAELVTDGERREALGRAARQHVSQQFSMKQMVDSYLQVFGFRRETG